MIELREARDEDLPTVASIHVRAWQHAYRGILADALLDALSVQQRLELWQRWCALPGSRLQLAVSAGEVVGFARLVADPAEGAPEGFAELTHLYLEPGRIGSGAGHALLCWALETAESGPPCGLSLYVLEGNALARRFYERHGLRQDGTRRSGSDLLGEGVHELRYVLPFEGTGL